MKRLLSTVLLIHLASSIVRPQTVDDNVWIPNGPVNAMVKSGNTMYLGGSFTYVAPRTGEGVAVDLATGAYDPALPKVNGTVYASVSDGSGGWYIGGVFTAVGGVGRANLAHIKGDKTLDAGWVSNTDGQVRALAYSGSAVYAGGSFTVAGGQPRSNIAALDPTTGSATAWNPGASGLVVSFAVSGPLVYAGGYFTIIGGQPRNRIAAIDQATGAVTVWDPNAGADIRAIVAAGPTVYVGGDFNTIGGLPRNHGAAIDSVTGIPAAWDPNVNGTVTSMAVAGPVVYFGGGFVLAGGQLRKGLAAIDAVTGLATSWNPGLGGFAIVSALAIYGTNLYTGGNYTGVGASGAGYLAAIDLATGLATSWDPQIRGAVYTVSIAGSTIYAGGSFPCIGGVPRNYIAAMDLATGQPNAWDPNANTTVSALALHGQTMYVAGYFTSIGGQPRNRIAALDVATGTPTGWNPNSGAEVMALAVAGQTVYASGNFTSIGGQARNRVAALDSATGLATGWNALANGNAVSIIPSGSTVYLAGSFTSIGGQTRNRLAELDASTAAATSWNPNANSLIYAMVKSGSILYVGGIFTSVGGQARNRIAAIDAATGLATGWNPNSNVLVQSLACSGPNVYAGGPFASIGGQTRYRIASIDTGTALATSWNPNGTSWVPDQGDAVLGLVVADGQVYAGGQFVDIGSSVHAYFARISDPSLTLTINATAHGNGIIDPAGSVSVPSGSDRGFLMTPATGYHIDSVVVDGANLGPLASYNFPAVSSNHAIDVWFSVNKYTLAVNAVNGAIGKNPDQPLYDHGTSVDLTANPSTGYHFVNWKGDASGTGNPVTILMDGDKNVTANFAINVYTLTLQVAGNGSVGKSPDQPSYDHGTIVEVDPAPAPGYLFTGWSGDASGSANPLQVTMDGDKNITATFTIDPRYEVTYRTAAYTDWAHAADGKGKFKPVKRKSDKVLLKFNIGAPANATGLTLSFSMKVSGALTSGKSKLVQVGDSIRNAASGSFTGLTIAAGDTFQFDGYGAAGKKAGVKVAWTASGGLIKQTITQFKFNDPKLPMPDLHNAGAELFPGGFGQTGAYFPSGLLIGVPQGSAAGRSVLHAKYTDVQKSLVKLVHMIPVIHADSIRCLDTFTVTRKPLSRQQKSLPPDKGRNILFAELLALKLNTAASAAAKFPAGLGELTFDDPDDPGNPFNGQPIGTILRKADTLISCLGVVSKPSPPTLQELCGVLHRINGAFNGPLDTLSFSGKTRFTGAVRLIDVPFLRTTPGMEPVSAGTGDAAGEERPSEFSLNQNYPNPFNPVTTLSFVIGSSGGAGSLVTLKVYDVLGKEVAVLIDHEMMDEGEQSLEFNAGGLASGVYFYRILIEPVDDDGMPAGPALTGVRKMLLLR